MSYDNKTKEQLAEELRMRDILQAERQVSDKKYAIKLVETIVFILVGLLATAVIGALINLVVSIPNAK